MSVRAWFDEGDIYVAGTDDIALAARHIHDHGVVDYEDFEPTRRFYKLDVDQALGPHWRRVTPCSPGCQCGRRGHLTDASASNRRGAFPLICWMWERAHGTELIERRERVAS